MPRVNCTYRYVPVVMDRTDPPYGVTAGILRTGDIVRVIRVPGCPAPGVMGHYHIETEGGQFAGLVCSASLRSKTERVDICPQCRRVGGEYSAYVGCCAFC